MAFDRNAPTPFDSHAWPAQLTGRVVLPGAHPRIHGYDVHGDLARYYSFGDAVYLSLTGELPSEQDARAFNIAMIFLAPAPVGEAPSHAAVLARICDGTTSAIVGTGAIALAEQARFVVAEHRAWLAKLGDVESEPVSADESVVALSEALSGVGVSFAAVDRAPTLAAAILALLHGCGLRKPEQLEAAWVVARIATVSAEALATPASSFRNYPLNTPPVRYEEDE